MMILKATSFFYGHFNVKLLWICWEHTTRNLIISGHIISGQRIVAANNPLLAATIRWPLKMDTNNSLLASGHLIVAAKNGR
jgi:hypothetical protein